MHCLPVVILLLVGCRPDAGPGDGDRPGAGTAGNADPSPRADTDTATGSPSVAPPEVSCVAQVDNVLRWDCEVTLEEAAPVEVSWASLDGPALTTVSEAVATEHDVTLWGLLAGTEVLATFRAGGASVDVRFTTAALPPEADVALEVRGSSTGDFFFLRFVCTGPSLIVDARGRILWYQPTRNEGVVGSSPSFLTPGGELVATENEDLVVRGLDGRERWRMRYGVDFDNPLHHDLYVEDDGRVYALHAELVQVDGEDYVGDGIYVFDATGLLAQWSVSDHIVPHGNGGPGPLWEGLWPDAVDFSHGNAISGVGNGRFLMSFRRIHTVLQVAADPDSPDFGTVDWTLVGQPGFGIPSDMSIESAVPGPANFNNNHHASTLPGAGLALFDNRTPDQGSRAIVLELDLPGEVATVTESYPLGQYCSIHGALYAMPNGNRLVTCSTARRVAEYEQGGTEPIFEIKALCDDGIVQRASPVDLQALAMGRGP